jgi:hypothetical protein
MIQGNQWQAGWDSCIPVSGAFATPLFRRADGGWIARPETALRELCEVLR